MGDRLEPENWEAPQKILAILAHPDDPEFFCGASIARWTSAGHLAHHFRTVATNG